MSQPIQEVDPSELRLPPSRASGADPWKLHQQIRQFGSSKDGMPPIFVYEDPGGLLEISDGVARAIRIAKLAQCLLSASYSICLSTWTNALPGKSSSRSRPARTAMPST